MRGKRRPKPLTCTRIIIDSGPLMVFLCATKQLGDFDESSIRRICSSHKEAKFYQEHGEEVLKIVGKKQILFTPHVVAEVSNRVKAAGFDIGRLLNEKNIIVRLLLSRGMEQHMSLRHLLPNKIFCNEGSLGITDCVLMILAKKEDLLLTHDAELKDRAAQLGIAAMLPKDVYYSVAG